jgi:hypothetical protein
MAATLGDVIRDLAAGHLTRAAAIELLRREFGEDDASSHADSSAEHFAQDLRAEIVRQGLDATLADDIVSAIWAPTADAAAAATRYRSRPQETQVRAVETQLRGAETQLRGAGTQLRRPPAPNSVPPTRVHAAAPRNASLPRDASQVAPGTVLKDRFELEALMGYGGMGTVYRAIDRRKVEVNNPRPQVAVKILNTRFQQHPDAFIALEREASKAQSLAHPNIVTVFDYDRDGGIVFISMELLQGQSLEAMIRAARNRGVGREAALPMIRGIAEGLGYAHRKGIVHSDLKPANIFVIEDGTPKILDFGIARAVPAANAGPRDQFDAGVLGAYTEAYATEEMVEGADPAPADDVFALGIIIYELLTGKHPFDGKTAAEARAARAAPAPIRSLRRREWRTLSRALAFDRAQRPRDADEFLRLFFGVTWLRNSLIAATLILATASGFLWYQNYLKSGPAVPFDQLPAATQQQITADFAEGEKAWDFYAKAGIANALTDSVAFYTDAYKLHPRDRDAVRGLKRAADAMLKRAAADPEALHNAARTLAETSDFLKTYPPVVKAIGP